MRMTPSLLAVCLVTALGCQTHKSSPRHHLASSQDIRVVSSQIWEGPIATGPNRYPTYNIQYCSNIDSEDRHQLARELDQVMTAFQPEIEESRAKRATIVALDCKWRLHLENGFLTPEFLTADRARMGFTYEPDDAGVWKRDWFKRKEG